MTMSDRIAVMRAGRIEQLGSPSDLYERPATAFVAGFLGVSNLLDGSVVGTSGELADVKLLDDSLVRAPSAQIEGTGPVRIGIRPEKLHVIPLAEGTAGAESGTNAVEGTIVDASYVGVHTQYLVKTADGHEMTVYAQNLETSGAADVLADGQRVLLAWKPEHTFVLTSEDTADQGALVSSEEESTTDG